MKPIKASLLVAALFCISVLTHAQSAFKDNFTGGYSSSIWNARTGSNGTPFGCSFSPAMISGNTAGITLNVSPGQCSELQTKGFYGYGRFEGSMKTGNTVGTVSSIFTYTSWWDSPGRAWQEIDIEFLPSLGNVVHTNVIYQPQNGQYQSWELDIGLSQYGIDIKNDLVKIGFEWSSTKIDWYLDDAWGNRHTIRTVYKNTAGQSSLNQIPAYAWPVDPARLMINHWHGDNSQSGLFFPKQYNNQTAWAYYDYIEYAKLSAAPTFSVLKQAEAYTAMLGIQTQTTTDTGGGQNVGWINAGDWMAYGSINIPATGSYRVEYRVASPSGSMLALDRNAGQVQLGQLAIPATGGWQNWVTISHVVQLPAGTHSLGIYAQQGGWNINWFRIAQL
jgi:hypothetical protein